jgi:hypothetical protein
MLIVREIVTAKPGNASKIAKLFKKVFVNHENVRVLSDLFANFNTIVLEYEVEDLPEYEQIMKSFETGSIFDALDPEIKKQMSEFKEMYFGGRREAFRVVE